MPGSVVLLVTSPRLPAGVLTAQAWDVVRAHPVLTAADSEQADALRAAGASVTVVEPAVTVLLDALAAHGTVVWLAAPDGDEQLARELGLRLAREPGLATLELLYGSWDPPGARVLDAVTVMDRLMHPETGDAWKRAQTHASLAPFLLEESYELYDAIRDNDLDAVREELGDVLLQVVLHARLAEDTPDIASRFTLDDVAGDLVAKLIRRNPHVFAGAEVGGIDDIIANWEQIKQAEKSRASAVDGVALSQPALALTAKLLHRVARAGLTVDFTPADPLGAALFALVVQAHEQGKDAEAALRTAALSYMDAVRRAE
ncbi:MazG family protein [Dactylosporangium aurantiacum]|uniref:MazG family protein n=1 Tax=Dactylosporangium aurantiacum TaxID=35754 RepID=A0A9Q9IG84_9ACTN|nr:MazG family protein [Dactylosporangium aurantiacum]MDG6105410.1 MazG family protein [Dactylosporangium aurantiacum]UWZ54048.1 MazG family protein [Dactylosporangium aurantiacum]